MGYAHIDNLYKNQEILMFKECYALEKVHGSSGHVKYKVNDNKLVIYAGGVSHELFVKNFDEEKLTNELKQYCFDHQISEDITFFGEAYGGKHQKMGETYGKELRFIVFDVNVDGKFLNVPIAEEVAKSFGLEFVEYELIPTDLNEINRCRDKPSELAIRRGMGDTKVREGVVLRPIIEVTKNNGERVCAKHKRDEFRETATPKIVDDPQKLEVLANAIAIAEEWVTVTRLQHVLDKIEESNRNHLNVINAMIEDVYREAKGEIVESPETKKAISKKTAQIFSKYMKESIAK